VPFKQSPGYLTFNKVMILEDSPSGLSGSLKRPEALKAPASSSEGPVAVQLVPYIWPDTATTVLTDKFKLITSGLTDEIANLPSEKRLQYAIDHVNVTAVPSYFKHYPLTIDVKVKIDALAKKFNYDHIEEGFHGMVFPELKTMQPMQQEDMIRMWGFSKYLLQMAEKTPGSRM
jgi:hypothetical protein